MRRSAALVAVLAILVTVPAACSGSDEKADARLSVQGVAEVNARGEGPSRVDGDRSLRAGDRVRVLAGTATVLLGGERQLELREGTTIELAGEPQEPVRPELVGGPLLVTTAGQPVTVTSAGTEILVTGATRVSRTPDLVVATYRGSTEVTADGRTMSVPAFRQTTVPVGGPSPDRPSPIEYLAADAWDQRLLGEAVDLGAQLLAKSRGFTSQSASGQNRTAADFRRLLPGLDAEPAFYTLFDPARPAGETLVGASVALESRKGTFADRWANVFGFRGEGADWGFVAFDQGVDRSAVLRLIDGAIGRAPTPVFAGGTIPPTPRAPAPTTTPRGRPSPPPTSRPPVSTATTLPSSAPPTTQPPLNTGTPVDETVNSLLDALNGLLRGLGGG